MAEPTKREPTFWDPIAGRFVKKKEAEKPSRETGKDKRSPPPSAKKR